MSGDRDKSLWPLAGLMVCLFLVSLHLPYHGGDASPDRTTAFPAWSSRPMAGPAQPRGDEAAIVPQLSPIPPLAHTASRPVEAITFPAEPAAVTTLPAGPTEPLARPEAPAELVAAVPEAPVGQEASEPETAPPAPLWCEPVRLLRHLEALALEERTRPWSHQVSAQLQELRKVMAQPSKEAGQILEQLTQLAAEVDGLAAQLGEEPVAAELRRAQHALQRRLPIWTSLQALGGLEAEAGRHGEPDRAALAQAVAEVDALLRNVPGGEAWRQYLELSSLRALTDPAHDSSDGWLTAAEVIRRLSQVSLTPAQQQVASREPFVRLVAELRSWANEPVALYDLLASLERYEAEGQSSDGRHLVADRIRLLNSPLPAERALGQQLEETYRNANFRFSVTAELANRMIPKREPSLEMVNDRVLGKPVHGQSLTTTDVHFRFLPDPHRLRTALEIEGRVASETSSFSGPATFFNSSWSQFSARKEIELGLHGLTLGEAEVEAQNQTHLRSLYTDFDPIPLLGSVAQEIARSQHENKQPQVQAELEQRVAARVKQQIDEETDARLGKLSERLQRRLFAPLAEMALGPTLVSSQTTEDRMTMRLLLASPMQLGAHTPRPRALGNTLASVQVHESALTNLVEQMQLSGQTLTLAELRQRIAQRLHRPEMAEESSENDDVTICLAAENGIQLRCDDGQLVITLSVVSLDAPAAGEQWENFQVQAVYQPQWDGRQAEFVREGVVRLISEDLSMRSQIALRGIFSKTFSKQRPLVLTPETMMQDPRLAGLSVTQVVLEDGWLSLGFGPGEPMASPRVAQRPVGTE